MCAWDDAGFLMAGGTCAGDDDEDHEGIVDGHAYTILDCENDVAGTEFDLIKVRNPWGSGELETGYWDDDGPGWEAHPEVKAALNPQKIDNGIFWMSKEEFFQFFRNIYVSGQAPAALPPTPDEPAKAKSKAPAKAPARAPAPAPAKPNRFGGLTKLLANREADVKAAPKAPAKAPAKALAKATPAKVAPAQAAPAKAPTKAAPAKAPAKAPLTGLSALLAKREADVAKEPAPAPAPAKKSPLTALLAKSAAKVAPTQIKVRLPYDAKPGDQITVGTPPDTADVVVPANIKPGTFFLVNLPVPPPAPPKGKPSLADLIHDKRLKAPNEHGDMTRKLAGKYMSRKQFKAIGGTDEDFNRLDLDNDGFLDKEELAIYKKERKLAGNHMADDAGNSEPLLREILSGVEGLQKEAQNARESDAKEISDLKAEVKKLGGVVLELKNEMAALAKACAPPGIGDY
eukprot:TRINITY_DN6077_c0_g1_i1.p1 TRINITY_DN6077_c0_g1~~TRINITY_DN6077_c0_g1_i1.p1  ORF type:complete len:458 (-),score=128.76 TRINITY_DN6077_c0_g1_i1:185-1558(-)